MNENNTLEIEKRNLVSTIQECLSEHEVILSGEKGDVPMSLIEVSGKGILLQDFLDTYGEEVQDFQKKVAKKVMSSKKFNQKYGVLVDKDLKYNFAFNRYFADIDKKEKKIKFISVEDLLLDANKIDYSRFDFPELTPVRERVVEVHHHHRDSRNTKIKYSLTGKKGNTNAGENNGKINFEKASLMDRIKKIYSQNEISLKFGEKTKNFLLVHIEYMTNTFTDFKRTYFDELDEFKEKLSRKIFGDEKKENRYVLLLNPKDLQIKFAFNSKFGRYDEKTQTIVYPSLIDLFSK